MIGLGNQLKILLRRFVAGIAIRMILQSELPVGFFDLFFTGVTINAEEFVIVLFAVQATTPTAASFLAHSINKKAPLLKYQWE